MISKEPECWIGDIIEFYDCPLNREIDKTKTYVDRISALHRITHNDGLVKYEIWTDLYPEAEGCCHVDPLAFIRVIEQSRIPKRNYPAPEIAFSDRVIFSEKEKSYISKISEIEQRIYNGDKDYCEYITISHGYSMTIDEFDEVIRAHGNNDGRPAPLPVSGRGC